LASEQGVPWRLSILIPLLQKARNGDILDLPALGVYKTSLSLSITNTITILIIFVNIKD